MPDAIPRLAVVSTHGDVAVVEVNPLALLRYRAGVPAGAAWQSTRGTSWSAFRPDRDGGLVRRGIKGRLQAALYLAAELEAL